MGQDHSKTWGIRNDQESETKEIHMKIIKIMYYEEIVL